MMAIIIELEPFSKMSFVRKTKLEVGLKFNLS